MASQPRWASLQKIGVFRGFVGEETFRLFIFSIIIGVVGFGADAFFLASFQFFLTAIGLLHRSLFLSQWINVSKVGALVMFLVAATIKTVISFSKVFLSSRVNQTFTRSIKSRILDSVFSSQNLPPLSDITEMLGPRLILSAQVLSHLSNIVGSLISVLLLTVLSLGLAPRELLLAAALLAVTIWPLKGLNKKAKEAGRAAVELGRAAGARLNVGIRNYFLLRIYGQEKDYSDGIKESLVSVEDHTAFATKLNGFQKAYPFIVAVMIVSGTTFVGSNYFNTDTTKLIAFFYLFLRIAQGTGESIAAWSGIKFGIDGLVSLKRWIGHREGLAGKTAASSNKDEKQGEFAFSKNAPQIQIEVENLVFSYPESESPTISELSLKMAPNTVSLICGPSGAGKSTLLSLILGLNRPDRGQVLINNIPASIARNSLFSHVGYVGPEPYLIPDSIRKNLLFGYPKNLPTPSDDQLWDALKDAGVHELVNSLPEKLEHNLSEGGNISTGQKQRVSLARALLRQPSLLLLDEATANLDRETEGLILAKLVEFKKRMTIITISHKDTFRSIADQVIAIEAPSKSQKDH